ncbi:CopG family transcriptional regulator [Paenibacillus odorifer]|uniref:ribbon-helix-helix domain-containing protein n=1 Tax=Paenibacillus odorifer TaxID=189426 RepID=UPI0020BDB755|nr:CopG family transcriptional regulator [Paenibacillus odorifer]
MKPVKLYPDDSFRETFERIDKIAGELNMTRSWLICELLKSALSEQQHFIHTVKGLES